MDKCICGRITDLPACYSYSCLQAWTRGEKYYDGEAMGFFFVPGGQYEMKSMKKVKK